MSFSSVNFVLMLPWFTTRWVWCRDKTGAYLENVGKILNFWISFFWRKWFEPRSHIPWLKKIIWVIGILRLLLVTNISTTHAEAIFGVKWKFKNPGERFDRSIDRVAVGKSVMWLAVKTCEAIDKCECNSLSIVECFIYFSTSECL